MLAHFFSRIREKQVSLARRRRIFNMFLWVKNSNFIAIFKPIKNAVAWLVQLSLGIMKVRLHRKVKSLLAL